MTKLKRASEVILTWQKRHKGIMDRNPEWAAQNIAIDLCVKGLLTPDLPESKEENEH